MVPRHKSSLNETAVLNTFLRHLIAGLKLSELAPAHFSAYRDERLKRAKPGTIIRELGLIQHALEVARKEWGVRPAPLQGDHMVDDVAEAWAFRQPRGWAGVFALEGCSGGFAAPQSGFRLVVNALLVV